MTNNNLGSYTTYKVGIFYKPLQLQKRINIPYITEVDLKLIYQRF